MGKRGKQKELWLIGGVGPALGFLGVLALALMLIPATGWGDNCSFCHTNASQLKGLVSPPLPSPEDEGEG